MSMAVFAEKYHVLPLQSKKKSKIAGVHYSVRTAPKLRLCYSISTDRPVFRYTREYYFPQKFNNGHMWVSL